MVIQPSASLIRAGAYREPGHPSVEAPSKGTPQTSYRRVSLGKPGAIVLRGYIALRTFGEYAMVGPGEGIRTAARAMIDVRWSPRASCRSAHP